MDSAARFVNSYPLDSDLSVLWGTGSRSTFCLHRTEIDSRLLLCDVWLRLKPLLFNWQEDSMIYVHDTGAVLLFAGGAVYCWIQTCLTYKLSQIGINTQFLFTIRFILSCIITVFGSLFFLAEIFAYEEFRQQSEHVVANWQPSDPGYSVHVLSNISEWIAALCFGLFGMTFFEEFQKISFHVECTPKCEEPRQGSPLLDYTNISEEEWWFDDWPVIIKLREINYRNFLMWMRFFRIYDKNLIYFKIIYLFQQLMDQKL